MQNHGFPQLLSHLPQNLYLRSTFLSPFPLMLSLFRARLLLIFQIFSLMCMLQTTWNPWAQLAVSYPSATLNSPTQPRTFFHIWPEEILLIKSYNPYSASFYTLLPLIFFLVSLVSLYPLSLTLQIGVIHPHEKKMGEKINAFLWCYSLIKLLWSPLPSISLKCGTLSSTFFKSILLKYFYHKMNIENFRKCLSYNKRNKCYS